MSAVTEYHDGADWVDISGRVPLEGWELREDAEEGSTPSSSMPETDDDLDWEPHGHRPFRVREPDSEVDDDLVFQGFTWNDDTGRGEAGSSEYAPLARTIAQEVNDANAVWQRPVMRGSDCNRPAETDVDRVQWLLATNEYAIFDDVTTYVHTGSTHNMDANDYRGQTGDQVMRDCAQESGKNWWAKYINNGVTRDLVAWYGRDSNSTYDSPLFLTNDPLQLIEAEMLDGTADTWPGQDWKVSRDYSRIYCGIYAQYDGGATFRHDTTTHTAYFGDPGPDSHRVMVVPMPNVHTLARAQARADRMLADIEDPDIHVTTTVRLPAAKVTQLRAGMRVPIFLTHEPEFDDWKWCRIVNATPTPVAAGSLYDVAIEAVPTGPPDSTGPAPDDFAGTAFAGLQRTNAYVGLGYLPAYAATYNTGENFPGWGVLDESGPLSVVEGAAPWLSIVTSAPITVRIEAQGQGANVFIPAQTRTLSVTVNGVVVGTDSRSTGTGFVSWTRTVDIHDYHLEAGDVVSVTGTATDEWGNSGVDDTFLRVGRGSLHLYGDDPTRIWLGP